MQNFCFNVSLLTLDECYLLHSLPYFTYFINGGCIFKILDSKLASV